jgi:hypothetical protein
MPRRHRIDVMVTRVEGQLGVLRHLADNLGGYRQAEQETLKGVIKELTRAIDQTLSCCFCGGMRHDVDVMFVAGRPQDRAAICDECLRMFMEMYRESGRSPTF